MIGVDLSAAGLVGAAVVVALAVLLAAGVLTLLVDYCQAPYVDAQEQPIVHACPPDGSGVMPCCGRTPLEVSHLERVTAYGPLVTCAGAQ